MQIPAATPPLPSGSPSPLFSPAAPPTPFLWQSSEHLRQHLNGLLDNISLLRAVADELDAIACVKAAQSGHNLTHVSKQNESLRIESSSLKNVSDSSANARTENDSLGSSTSSFSTSLLLQAVEGRSSDLQGLESLAMEASKSLQQSIETQLAPLTANFKGNARWEEAAAVARLADKQLKIRRSRRWRQRRRQRAADALRKERESYDRADQEADEWRAKEIAKDIARRKVEKMKEVAKQKAKEERHRLEEELELVLIVEKLQQLRSIRIQKLKRQGHFFPEEDNRFMERVQAAVEQEERQAAAAADTSATAAAIANAEEAGKAVGLTGLNENLQKEAEESVAASKAQKEPGVSSKDSVVANQKEIASIKREETKSIGQDGHGGLPAEFYHYYHGSSADMGTLIEVRRTWDTFIMPGGSRIPGHWIEPPPPADSVWASYLVNAEEKHVEHRKRKRGS